MQIPPGSARLDLESRSWIEGLRATGAEYARALERLHDLLLRAAYSEAQREESIKELKGGRENRNVEVQRYKGLGEMTPEQLWTTTMDPATRTILRVDLEDVRRVDIGDLFETLMGDEVQPRKAFIQEYARTVRNLDI